MGKKPKLSLGDLLLIAPYFTLSGIIRLRKTSSIFDELAKTLTKNGVEIF